jgi:4'-phosphopantetheinyl transferase
MWETSMGETAIGSLDDTIAVYLLSLHAGGARAPVEEYLSILSADEQARWREFRLAERGWQYLQSRVLQRQVLAAYTARAPDELRFVRNAWGRPHLADHERIHFNLSHCASHVALAVGADALLGIDVESTLPQRRNFMHIAAQQFNEAQLKQLLACPEALRYERFLELWTLSEAYLKALGLGMHKPMADTTFTTDGSGVWRCHDRAMAVMPLDFLSRSGSDGCQLALAYRDHLHVALRHLAPGALLPAHA